MPPVGRRSAPGGSIENITRKTLELRGNVCRSLFEKHSLVSSFRIAMNENDVHTARSGRGATRPTTPQNRCTRTSFPPVVHKSSRQQVPGVQKTTAEPPGGVKADLQKTYLKLMNDYLLFLPDRPVTLLGSTGSVSCRYGSIMIFHLFSGLAAPPPPSRLLFHPQAFPHRNPPETRPSCADTIGFDFEVRLRSEVSGGDNRETRRGVPHPRSIPGGEARWDYHQDSQLSESRPKELHAGVSVIWLDPRNPNLRGLYV
ncbi:hypothetical protein EYF80_040114 [Liparis tanakae]|uniref:Uncharacterized protein n=1 Tax=Liparis tanakae TaxID=230148 RepID=A0A4Z2G9Z9_9TELE|nr:hypothetical protein EYF80_040114 [Liparis tanakae]